MGKLTRQQRCDDIIVWLHIRAGGIVRYALSGGVPSDSEDGKIKHEIDIQDWSKLRKLTEDICVWRDSLAKTALVNTRVGKRIMSLASSLENIKYPKSSDYPESDSLRLAMRYAEDLINIAKILLTLEFPSAYGKTSKSC